MAYISLEQAKKHLQIDTFYTEDDEYINQLIDVAIAVAQEDICRNLDEFVKEGILEPGVQHALLLLVSNYYNNREPVAFATSAEVPLSYRHLIGLYRDYLG